jgi:hypothetical protein
MRKTLEGVRAAAALILSALDDGETRGFLDAASPGTIPDRLAIRRLMSDLVRRAEEGVSWLVTENGETKVGRNRAVPPGSFPPKTYCAAIIAEAWSFVHGVEPAPKNQKAAAAAHLFWRESFEGLSMEQTKLALEWMRAKDAKKKLGRAAQRLAASFRAGERASRVRDAQGNPPPPHGRQASSRDVCGRLNRPEKPPI